MLGMQCVLCTICRPEYCMCVAMHACLHAVQSVNRVYMHLCWLTCALLHKNTSDMFVQLQSAWRLCNWTNSSQCMEGSCIYTGYSVQKNIHGQCKFECTESVPVSMQLRAVLVAEFQKRMHLSAVPPPEASRPCWCGDQAMALTAALWSLNLMTGDVEFKFQMYSWLSFPPLAISLSSGDHFSPHTCINLKEFSLCRHCGAEVYQAAPRSNGYHCDNSMHSLPVFFLMLKGRRISGILPCRHLAEAASKCVDHDCCQYIVYALTASISMPAAHCSLIQQAEGAQIIALAALCSMP